MRNELRAPFAAMPRVVIGIVAVWIITYIIWLTGVRIGETNAAVAMVISAIPLTTDGVVSGKIWQLLTYALVHDPRAVFAVLFNSLIFAMFGNELAQRWGTKRFTLFAIGAALFGAAFYLLGDALGLNRTDGAIGGDAVVEAALVAWGLTWPRRDLRLFFVLNVPGIAMVALAVFVWLLKALSPSPYGAAVSLGGIVAGALFAKVIFNHNGRTLGVNRLLVRLGLKKEPKLVVVPKPDKWVN